jgi:hypothetical protein
MLSRLWKWGSVFIGAKLLRNVDGRSFSRAWREGKVSLFWGIFNEEFERYFFFKKGPCKRAALSIGASVVEPGGGSFTGTF